MLKVLISCYACSPNRGSEPGMGWSFVKEISKFHEVHVIVEKLKWESEIKDHLKEFPSLAKNLHFHFINKERNKKLRKIWPPSYYWYYKLWQKKAYKLATKLNELEHFDVVHQLNMVGFREPGYLWKMNKPFVWGPIGGMENTNWKLLFNLSIKEFLFYSLRNTINTYQKFFLSRPRKAANVKDSYLIAATEKNKNDIQKFWNVKSIIIPEVGMNEVEFQKTNKRDKLEPLKIIWSGQHTGGKALNILLKSLVLLPDNVNWELHILGDGHMTKKWKHLSKKLKINANCKWYGWVEKNTATEVMKSAHVLCITSVKDLTSTVTLEGLSYGLPIISIDHCGFSNVINSTCGIKIPIRFPNELHHLFSNAIKNMYFDENLRRKLCKGAYLRAQSFTWYKKGEKINNIYLSLFKNKHIEK